MTSTIVDYTAPQRPMDLRGEDYFTSRRRLFLALAALRPGEQLCLLTSRTTDVHWLRYETEERIAHRYLWSLPEESVSGARTVVRDA